MLATTSAASAAPQPRDRVRPVLAITGEARAASTWQRTAHEIGYDMAQLFAALLLDEVACAGDGGVVLS